MAQDMEAYGQDLRKSADKFASQAPESSGGLKQAVDKVCSSQTRLCCTGVNDVSTAGQDVGSALFLVRCAQHASRASRATHSWRLDAR